MSRCIALVSNQKYLQRALRTIFELRVIGKWSGDVVLCVGDDLASEVQRIQSLFLDIQVVHFADLIIMKQRDANISNKDASLFDFSNPKEFQYHKLHIFSVFFKRWSEVLYLDAGMRVYSEVEIVFQQDCQGVLIAHSDSYPNFEWTLESQFDLEYSLELTSKLEKFHPLDSDYFQTGFMLFDTNLIKDDTLKELTDLAQRFPNSRTNDQGIINLWALSSGYWRRMPTSSHYGKFIYDFTNRAGFDVQDYCLIKYPKGRGSIHRVLSLLLFRAYRLTVLRRLGSSSAFPLAHSR